MTGTDMRKGIIPCTPSRKFLQRLSKKEQTGDGVVARIGGDEYACALMTEKKKELLLQELYDAFTVRNEQSDKPYNVTVPSVPVR